MESILRDELMRFLEENNLINNFHHGLKHKCSCLTNLLDFYNEVFNTYDETRVVDIIYLDFQKVFDKVPHKRLLTKLKLCGVSGNHKSSNHKWLEDWVSARKQRVVIHDKVLMIPS